MWVTFSISLLFFITTFTSFFPTSFAALADNNMGTRITVSVTIEELWFREATKEKEGSVSGRGNGDVLAQSYKSKSDQRKWLVGSPPIWYKSALDDNQKTTWKAKPRTNMAIQNLKLGAHEKDMVKYWGPKRKFLVENGNALVDPFHIQAGVQGAQGAVQTNNTGAGGKPVTDDEDETA
jgi:hypothetical protein